MNQAERKSKHITPAKNTQIPPPSTQKKNEDNPHLKMLFILILMCLVPIQLPSQQVKLTYPTPLFPHHTHLNLQQRCSVGSNYQDSFQHLFLEENMTPKSILHLSGDEIGKECIKLGLSGRFTMKEALVELSLALARSGIDPKTHQFNPSQPLIDYFPYQVIILTDIVETTRALPTSMRGGAFPTSSMASPMLAPSSRVASSHLTQAPLCPSIPFHPPTSPNIPTVTQTQVSVMDKQVSVETLTTVKRMCCIFERPGNPVKQQNGQTDSDSKYFSGFSSSSNTPSLLSGTTVPSTSSIFFRSQSSTYWRKSKLREESICIKFPHGSYTFDDWHTGNAHLCAKCYLSVDECLEPDHRTENNDIKMEEIEQAVAIEHKRLEKLTTARVTIIAFFNFP